MTKTSRAAALLAEKKHAWLTRVDEVAMAMEANWGVGRLPRLVEQLENHGELGKDTVDDVQKSMEVATLVGPVFFLVAGLGLSVLMLVFFAGRRGRILYGLEKPLEQRS